MTARRVVGRPPRQPGGCEGRDRADVELLRDRGGRRHRVGLECPRPLCPRMVDRGARQGSAHATSAEAGPGEQAGHRPHPGVGRVLVAPGPRHPSVAGHAGVGRSWLDGAPADGLSRPGTPPGPLVPDPGSHSRVRSRSAECRLLRGDCPEGLPGRQLVALAPAPRGRAPGAEHQREVLPGHRVRAHDGDVHAHGPHAPLVRRRSSHGTVARGGARRDPAVRAHPGGRDARTSTPHG